MDAYELSLLYYSTAPLVRGDGSAEPSSLFHQPDLGSLATVVINKSNFVHT